MAKWCVRISLAVVGLFLIVAGSFYFMIRASLPMLEGEVLIETLGSTVEVERDALGTVTILASNEIDAARSLGYVHAQERFFEMDLLRRAAAGELSEIFGAVALDKDKNARIHRFRARLRENIDAFVGEKLEVLKAYVDGVNRGINGLSARPWPYILLGVEPTPWRIEDCALTAYAMFFDLQDENNKNELALWKIKQSVPSALYQLISADGTPWDAPLFGNPRSPISLPSEDVLDLRKLPSPPIAKGVMEEHFSVGSNNFAVGGTLTKDGRAIVADDMHLGLGAPNIWFRARLKYSDTSEEGGQVDVNGFTLPGLPGVVVGSNGHISWGFTNSYGDWLDWRIVKKGEAINTFHEKIVIKNQEAIDFEIRESDGHPIMAQDMDGSDLALFWVAHLPGSVNSKLFDLPLVKDTEQAIDLFHEIGMPHQNAVVGDKFGKIGWTLTGMQKQRQEDCDRTAPLTKNGKMGSNCFSAPGLEKYSHPQQISPPSDRIWTANNRVTDHEMLKQIGDSGYANGARAKQIRDSLFAQSEFTEKDLLVIQLDDRAIFLKHWWDFFQQFVESKSGERFDEIREATQKWEGRASVDSVSYRFIKEWRSKVVSRIKNVLTGPAQLTLGESFVMPSLTQIEGVAWQLVNKQPPHLLSNQYKNWEALLLEALDETYLDLKKIGPLQDRTWGEKNTASICHPFAKVVPDFLASWLCMTPDQLNGDTDMPLVAGARFGASQRMVVSPGHEKDGIIHMPGGQSGHPFSPFWGSGHSAFVKQEPTAFLPGEAVYKLILRSN